MSTTRSERTQSIEVLEKHFANAKGIYLTAIDRITVEQVTKLRCDFRKKGITYIVVKNTLARKALERTGKSELAPYFKGSIGVAISQNDATSPSRIIRDFKKETKKDNKELLDIKCSYVEGTIFNALDTIKLADIPSREELLSQLLGCLKAPIQKFAGTLNGVISKLPATLDALKTKKEAIAS